MILKINNRKEVEDMLYKLLIKAEDWIRAAKKKLNRGTVISDRDPVLDNWAPFVRATFRKKSEIQNYAYYQRYHGINLDHNQNIC